MLFAAITIAVAGIWLYTNTGAVIFTAFGKTITMPFAVFIIATIILFFIINAVTAFIKWIGNIPYYITHSITKNKPSNADILEKLILAYENNNIHELQTALKYGKKHNISPHVFDLYNALTEEAKDLQSALLLYKKFLQSDRLHTVGLYKLAAINHVLGNDELAFEYAQQLCTEHKSYNALVILLEIMISTERYADIIKLLEDNNYAKLLESNEHKHILAQAYSMMAVENYLQGDYYNANELSTIANKFSSEPVGIELQILTLIKLGERKTSIALLQKHHHTIDDMKLYSMMSSICSSFDAQKIYSQIKNAFADTKHNAYVILAKAALNAGDHSEALKLINHALEQNHMIANLLMADYCLKTQSSTSEISEWLDKFFQSIDYITMQDFIALRLELLQHTK